MQQKHELSFWERNTFLSGFDIVIIGGGIVGLSAGIYLKKYAPSLKVLLLERGILPYGASTRNAGFACFGSLSELIEDEKKHSESEIYALLEKRFNGLIKLRKLIGDKNLGYEGLGGFEIFTKEEEQIYLQCLDKQSAYNQLLFSLTKIKDTYNELSPNTVSGFGFGQVKYIIKNQLEGQLDTGKMMHSLLKLAQETGVEMITGAEVSQLEESENGVTLFCTNGWEIKTGKILITTNGFTRNILKEADVLPARNQVWITEPVEGLPWKGAFHYQSGYFYFRNVGNRVLLGGGRNLSKEAETTDAFGESLLIQSALRDLLDNVILPGNILKPEMKWSGIMGVGESKTPIVKKYSDKIWLAVRMGGMGVAIGNQIGEDVAMYILSE